METENQWLLWQSTNQQTQKTGSGGDVSGNIQPLTANEARWISFGPCSHSLTRPLTLA
jgi:hypothetical protein